MLRIGQFCDSFLPVVDGVGRVVIAYAESLCAMGHQVTVSSPMYDTGYRGGYPFELVDYNAVHVPGAKQYKTGRTVMDMHYRKRMEMIQLDIAHTHTPFGGGAEALRIARRQNIPIVYTFHSKFHEDFFKATKSEKLAELGVKYVVNFMNRCDEVWTVSDAAADVIRDYGYKGMILTMPNGVKVRSPQPNAAMEVSVRFGLRDYPVLLYVGQMDWKKNILRILEASALLKKKGVAFRLVLAGQGYDYDAISRKSNELDLAEYVIMTGHITDPDLLNGLYCRASILTLPSMYDMASMVVREAAVMGTPSVLVKGSTVAEVIMDGINGLLCSDCSDDLCKVLEFALSDPAKLKCLGENARQTIPIPWEVIMSDVVKQYERLICSYNNSKNPSISLSKTETGTIHQDSDK